MAGARVRMKSFGLMSELEPNSSQAKYGFPIAVKHLMNRSKWFFCLLILVAGQSSSPDSQNLCSVETISFPAVSGRALSIGLPNGISIRVVGHEHGERDIQGKILGTLANSQLSDAEVIAITQPLVNSLSTTLAQYHGDVLYLADVLSVTPEIILWVEASENALDQIRSYLVTAMKLRKGSQMDDGLLLAAGPILYLEATSKLPSGTQVKGVENISAEIQMDWKRADDLKKGSLSFEEIENANAKAFRSVVPLVEKWNKMLEGGQTDQLLNYDTSKIDTVVDAGNYSNQIASSLKMRLKAYLIEHQSSIKRDRANVQKIIEQNKSSVFLVGLLHVDPTLTFLQRSCQNGR